MRQETNFFFAIIIQETQYVLLKLTDKNSNFVVHIKVFFFFAGVNK
jgi:hypothetical protein